MNERNTARGSEPPVWPSFLLSYYLVFFRPRLRIHTSIFFLSLLLSYYCLKSLLGDPYLQIRYYSPNKIYSDWNWVKAVRWCVYSGSKLHSLGSYRHFSVTEKQKDVCITNLSQRRWCNRKATPDKLTITNNSSTPKLASQLHECF